MPAPKLSDAQAMQAAEAYKRLGTEGYTLIQGLSTKAFDSRVATAVQRGFVSREDRRTIPKTTPMPPLLPAAQKEAPPQAQASAPGDVSAASVKASLARGTGMTLEELASRFKAPRGTILNLLDEIEAAGGNLTNHGGKYSLAADLAPRYQAGDPDLPIYTSRPDGSYLFGFTSDNHLGSKYARLDCLNDLYDQFAAQGVDRVFNAGNWVDGEARFNVHDLLVHGMDPQLQYLAKHYPQRPGVTTYAVAGDDHEGWWAQREAVDVGRYAERVMRAAGRDDWVDMGYMEAYIRLRHAGTGKETMLHLMHPGGGSAYAVSYTVQKIVEAYDGGDKPAVLLAGHYHKLSYNIVRGVHAIQTGTTEDQTPFMRKKKLSAHVGGGICRLTQDPATGAILSCRVEFFTYFVRGYYNDRWSPSGDVVLADRGV